MSVFVKLKLDQRFGDYSSQETSGIPIYILGFFLSDMGCAMETVLFFQQWPFDDSESDCISTNSTCLEKENGYIYMKDTISSDEPQNIKLKISYQQFSQLMIDWQAKVYNQKPKEVIIKYENNQFTIET